MSRSERRGAGDVKLDDYPTLRVRSTRPEAIFTTVELDGKPIPATRVAFDTGKDVSGLIRITLEFYGKLDVEVSGVPAAVTDVDPVKAELPPPDPALIGHLG